MCPAVDPATDDGAPLTVKRPRRRDAERNHAAILEAPPVVFGRSGWEASMQEVAEQAGVGVGTLYRHFGSKDEMAGAILAHHFDAMAFRVGEIAARGGSFERLSCALRRSVADVAANPLARWPASA